MRDALLELLLFVLVPLIVYGGVMLKSGAPTRERLGTPTSPTMMLLWVGLGLGGGALTSSAAARVGLHAEWILPGLGALLGGAAALFRAQQIAGRWARALERRSFAALRQQGTRLWLEIQLPPGVFIKARITEAEQRGFRREDIYQGTLTQERRASTPAALSATEALSALGEARFDQRFSLGALTPQGLAYLTPKRRACLIQHYAHLERGQPRSSLRLRVSFFGGSEAAIQAALKELSAMSWTLTRGESPEDALLRALSEEERHPLVLLTGLNLVSMARRGEAIDRIWARRPLWADRAPLAWVPHPGQPARLKEILAAPEAPDEIRARILDLFAEGPDAESSEHTIPVEALLERLEDSPMVQAVALKRLSGLEFCLTPEWMERLLAREIPWTASGEEALLKMAELGWHPASARCVRGLLKSPHEPTRHRAIRLLGLKDNEVGALNQAAERASLSERRLIEGVIAQIRARAPEGVGALSVAQAEGELSLAAEGGAVSLVKP